MWEVELNGKQHPNVVNKIGSIAQWYLKAAQYWENTEATTNGVLGGFGILHEPDIHDSNEFLDFLNKNFGLQYGRVIDCGAGTGRITKELLLKHFQTVDVVDQNPKYIEHMAQEFNSNPQVQLYITSGLQSLNFTELYDCIWIQWVSNYLTDDDFINFLTRCKNALKKNVNLKTCLFTLLYFCKQFYIKGIIIVKENIANSGFVVDKEDNSVTRSEQLFLELFNQVQLVLVADQLQSNFPKELFKVKSYALMSQY
ncbi:phosphoethanolamine n-methyltransferase, putative [Ichthyophthirius multifiliis]|uniref:Alpha N-terminal protein methyltransferase 1 n=1 Tax=Ichthyophthirius multifiliis TaxID=5932 RepID=G0QYY6_ICHMU|nr:phosphoethanolamine n-methyltransferase, putative [Ichthyophthirius multifiliis]EGR29557.1 phosphoethanolamine n-methyltransferase, putative [Ichthyophthirius multifiliis]|eukprot:XP_004030793.1 phosphoethanolamine n-methyltransferase, putative [Ichthyophthirius multifiliis]